MDSETLQIVQGLRHDLDFQIAAINARLEHVSEVEHAHVANSIERREWHFSHRIWTGLAVASFLIGAVASTGLLDGIAIGGAPIGVSMLLISKYFDSQRPDSERV